MKPNGYARGFLDIPYIFTNAWFTAKKNKQENKRSTLLRGVTGKWEAV